MQLVNFINMSQLMDQLIDFIAQPSCLRPTIINLTGQIDIRNIHLSFNHQFELFFYKPSQSDCFGPNQD